MELGGILLRLADGLAWHARRIANGNQSGTSPFIFDFQRRPHPKCVRMQLDTPASHHGNETGVAALSDGGN